MQLIESLVETGIISTAISRNLKSGEIVFHPQDAALKLFCLKTGQVKLAYYAENGQLAYQDSIRPGQCFGELALIQGTHRVSAIAAKASQIFEIPGQTITQLLNQNPHLSMTFIAELIEQLQSVRTLLGLRYINSARTRLLEYLYSLEISADKTHRLEIPFREIAEQLGLSPEAISRALRELEEEGVIRRDRRTITFLQR